MWAPYRHIMQLQSNHGFNWKEDMCGVTHFSQLVIPGRLTRTRPTTSWSCPTPRASSSRSLHGRTGRGGRDPSVSVGKCWGVLHAAHPPFSTGKVSIGTVCKSGDRKFRTVFSLGTTVIGADGLMSVG